MSLWTPPEVSRELREETREREAVALTVALNAKLSGDPLVKEFDRLLAQVEPGMELLFCPDPCPIELVVIGARPGRWGILMPSKNGGPASVMPIVGPDGEFVEPTSRVFDELMKMDWWNPDVRRERARVQEELKEAKRKREEEEDRQRDEEVLERYLAGNRAFVSMSRDTPWSQNVNGRRGARRG